MKYAAGRGCQAGCVRFGQDRDLPFPDGTCGLWGTGGGEHPCVILLCKNGEKFFCFMGSTIFFVFLEIYAVVLLELGSIIFNKR
jgi:hypothetical protein